MPSTVQKVIAGHLTNQDVASSVPEPGEVTTTTVAVTTLVTIAIPDDTVVLIDVEILARQTNGAGRATYIRRAVVFREATGPATLEGAVDSPFTRESDTPWDATIVVDGGNNALVEVTGQATKEINWEAFYRTRQII